MTEADIIFEPYERKINRQQKELRRMNEEREHLLKVIHKKNLQGMRLVRRRRELQVQVEEAKEIIRKLCGAVRALNNPNTQLTDVNGFLQNAEAFINKE